MNYCPTCRRTFVPRGVVAKVLSGEEPAHKAPRIFAGWLRLQHRLHHFGELSRAQVIAELSDDLAETTIDAIIRAARQLGLLQVDYRLAGEPRRKTAFLSMPVRDPNRDNAAETGG